MAIDRPSLSDLVDRIKKDLESRLASAGSILRRSVLYVIAKVQAGGFHLLYGRLEYLSLQIFPSDADEQYLLKWSTLFNVPRKQATFAGFNVSLVGSNGSVVPAGTILKRSDDVEFTTLVDATIVSGSISVGVICSDAGATGNTDPDSTLNFVSPVSGVNSQATVGSVVITGEDQEGLELWRARIILKIQTPPQGGALSDYVAWALSVAGVTRAWPYQDHLGPGTVGLAFVMDRNVGSIIPSTDQIAAVQAFVDSVRPVTAIVTCFAPIADTLNFTIGISPTTASVKAAVIAELTDLIQREGEPGGTLLLSHINEAIATAAGEVDHALTSPSANVVSASGHIPVMGTVTWV